MPTISMFYGIIIYMYFFDDKRHHVPHVHAEYAEHTAVLAIATGEVLDGHLPSKQLKLAQAWMAIHEDDLFADWKLAIQGQEVFRIEPLK